jgi:hypothetical protein
MKDKFARLSKAFRNETVRRLPYIVVLLIILSFIQFFHLNQQTAKSVRIATENSADSRALLKKVAALSEDNKKLTQQNIDLSQKNTDQIKCITKLFALGQRPLQVDVDTCFIQADGQTLSMPGQSASRQSSVSPAGGSGHSSSSQSTPNNQNAQPNNVQPKQPDPQKVLGIPACLPFTQLCVR